MKADRASSARVRGALRRRRRPGRANLRALGRLLFLPRSRRWAGAVATPPAGLTPLRPDASSRASVEPGQRTNARLDLNRCLGV